MIDKFLKVKLENRKRNNVMGKPNGFEVLEDLHNKLQALNEKYKNRILVHKIMHPSSEIPSDKHTKEQKLALKLQVEKIKREIQSAILTKQLKFELIIAPGIEEYEGSGTQIIMKGIIGVLEIEVMFGEEFTSDRVFCYGQLLPFLISHLLF